MTYTQYYGYLYVILMCGHRWGRDAFLAINTPCQSVGATAICQKLKYPRQISDTCFRSRTKRGLFIKTPKKNISKFSNSTKIYCYILLFRNHIYQENLLSYSTIKRH